MLNINYDTTGTNLKRYEVYQPEEEIAVCVLGYNKANARARVSQEINRSTENADSMVAKEVKQ